MEIILEAGQKLGVVYDKDVTTFGLAKRKDDKCYKSEVRCSKCGTERNVWTNESISRSVKDLADMLRGKDWKVLVQEKTEDREAAPLLLLCPRCVKTVKNRGGQFT